MWIFFLLFVSSYASPLTYKPQIIDTYDVALFNNNTYFNKKFINESSLLYDSILDTPIDVYNLDLKRIKQIHQLNVECDDTGVCDKSISERERQYLSLYVSMLEVCGITTISDSYSLGLLRDKQKEYVMGQFTKSISDSGIVHHMGFWIRLEQDGKLIYDEYDTLGLTVAMMELAVHERAHHDVTKVDLYAGHCDMYQTQYNMLIRESIFDIHHYTRLTHYIMKTDDNYVFLFGTIGGLVLVTVIILIAVFTNKEKSNVKNKSYV
jgi:hypothetical protein